MALPVVYALLCLVCSLIKLAVLTKALLYFQIAIGYPGVAGLISTELLSRHITSEKVQLRVKELIS